MAQRRRSKRKRDNAPSWLWMLAGFALGLSVAAGVYVVDRRPLSPVAGNQPEPRSQRDEPIGTAPAEQKFDFDFYEILPKFEVIIPETERDVRPDSNPTALQEPGSYVLQAGSFTGFSDADRMKANLALLGIESNIQKVSIDADTFHRVRIGPIDDLARLNRIRRQLRDARIEVMVIRIPAG